MFDYYSDIYNSKTCKPNAKYSNIPTLTNPSAVSETVNLSFSLKHFLPSTSVIQHFSFSFFLGPWQLLLPLPIHQMLDSGLSILCSLTNSINSFNVNSWINLDDFQIFFNTDISPPRFR